MRYNRCPVCGQKFAESNLRPGRICIRCQVRDALAERTVTDWLGSELAGQHAGPMPAAPKSWQSWSERAPDEFRAHVASLIGSAAATRRPVPAPAAEPEPSPTLRERAQRWLFGLP